MTVFQKAGLTRFPHNELVFFVLRTEEIEIACKVLRPNSPELSPLKRRLYFSTKPRERCFRPLPYKLFLTVA